MKEINLIRISNCMNGLKPIFKQALFYRLHIVVKVAFDTMHNLFGLLIYMCVCVYFSLKFHDDK